LEADTPRADEWGHGREPGVITTYRPGGRQRTAQQGPTRKPRSKARAAGWPLSGNARVGLGQRQQWQRRGSKGRTRRRRWLRCRSRPQVAGRGRHQGPMHHAHDCERAPGRNTDRVSLRARWGGKRRSRRCSVQVSAPPGPRPCGTEGPWPSLQVGKSQSCLLKGNIKCLRACAKRRRT
jgi:hypothetical protein